MKLTVHGMNHSMPLSSLWGSSPLSQGGSPSSSLHVWPVWPYTVEIGDAMAPPSDPVHPHDEP